MMLPCTSSPLDSRLRGNDVLRGNERDGKIPPSQSVRGLGGCLQFNNCQRIPCISLRSPRPLTLKRRGRGGASWQSFQNHVNHGSPPVDSRLRGNDGRHPPSPFTLCEGGRCGGASWQSWFNASPLWIPAYAGMTWGIPLAPLRSAKGGYAVHHGNHFKIMAIMVQRVRCWNRVSLREID